MKFHLFLELKERSCHHLKVECLKLHWKVKMMLNYWWFLFSALYPCISQFYIEHVLHYWSEKIILIFFKVNTIHLISFWNCTLEPWLLWLSGLSASLQTRESVVRFPVSGTCLGCRPGPQNGAHKRQTQIDVSVPLFPSLKVNK